MVNNSDEVLEKILATDENARLEWEKTSNLKMIHALHQLENG